MGASGAYGGSGGKAWAKAREQAADFVANPTPAGAEALLSDIADALDWDVDGDAPPELVGPQRPALVTARPRLRSRSGGGDGPGGGGGGGGSAGRGTGHTGGGRHRSRSRAAAVGGSVVAAGLALRDRDEQALQRFGLTLSELDALNAHEQARLILEAVAGSVGGIQEDELQHASGVAALTLLDDGATAEDAVRAFVVDYVFEVAITEVGDQFRDGTRDGYTTVDEEDRLRDIIETGVNQIDLPQRLDAENIQRVVYRALDEARTYLQAEQ
jgi:hypothetical protein